MRHWLQKCTPKNTDGHHSSQKVASSSWLPWLSLFVFLLFESSLPLRHYRVGKEMMRNQARSLSNPDSILRVYNAPWRIYADTQIVVWCAQDEKSIIFQDFGDTVGFSVDLCHVCD